IETRRVLPCFLVFSLGLAKRDFVRMILAARLAGSRLARATTQR
ncbi:hypothetical protein A2U01_0046537, partial [Trifolium medium]|nr:hypothetical protein [Trifolium medium]